MVAVLVAALVMTLVTAGRVRAQVTLAGVPLPQGYVLQKLDTFGRHGSVGNFRQLHRSYCEGFQCNLFGHPATGTGTFVPFEKAAMFFPDHLEIQARSQPDGSITSAFMVAKYASRSFCIEARYQIPGVLHSRTDFWFYADDGTASSEIDFEQALGIAQTVYSINVGNHPALGTVTPADIRFATVPDNVVDAYLNTTTNYAAAPHYYTACYDDGGATLTKWVDGGLIYTDNWQWQGSDPHMLLWLVADNPPPNYAANLEVYSVGYYAP